MNTIQTTKKDRISLVIGGILVMLTQLSISANCFSIFIIPICTAQGFARGVYTWTQSCLSLGGVFASLCSGRIFNRYGIVRCMRIGGICSTCLYLIQSLAVNIPHFYLINLAIGFFNCFCTSMPLSLLIGERFTEKRNTIIGIVMMGSGFGTSIFNSLASRLILDLGWRGAMRRLGLIMAAVSLVSYFILIREVGDNEPVHVQKAEVKAAPAEKQPPFFRGRNLLISLMCVMIAIGAGSFMSTVTPHLQDIGYTQTFAASVYSASMLVMAFGKIIHGIIIDRWGIRTSNSVMLVTALIGVVGLLNFKAKAYAVLICLGMAFISSLQVVGMPAIAEALGGLKNKKHYLGKLAAATSFGYCLAPFIYGTVYDKCGTYVPMYYVSIILLSASLAGVLILLPKKADYAKD